MKLDDEVLCAYLDGELEAEQLSAVEQALASDAGARVRLDRMRSADARLRADIPLAAPSSIDPLVEHILHGAPMPKRAVFPWRTTLSALAAGVGGLIIGVTLSLNRTTTTVADIAPSTSQLLAQALDQSASGAVITQGERSVQSVLTFLAADGSYCRLFKTEDTRSGAEGVACRRAGEWQVVAWDSTAGTEQFRTAGASALLDDVMDRLGGSAALEPAQEQELIKQRWPASK